MIFIFVEFVQLKFVSLQFLNFVPLCGCRCQYLCFVEKQQRETTIENKVKNGEGIIIIRMKNKQILEKRIDNF